MEIGTYYIEQIKTSSYKLSIFIELIQNIRHVKLLQYQQNMISNHMPMDFKRIPHICLYSITISNKCEKMENWGKY